jgi:hypothetical protein
MSEPKFELGTSQHNQKRYRLIQLGRSQNDSYILNYFNSVIEYRPM